MVVEQIYDIVYVVAAVVVVVHTKVHPASCKKTGGADYSSTTATVHRIQHAPKQHNAQNTEHVVADKMLL